MFTSMIAGLPLHFLFMSFLHSRDITYMLQLFWIYRSTVPPATLT